MSDELYQYYEQELAFFRQMAGEFAQKYPKIAGRLQLEETTDPHVERLIEAVALLTSRVRRKIDDEFPEVVESLLNMLYPHYLRPLPPMAVAQFRFDPQQTRPTEPSVIPAGATLSSRASGGLECTFRTAYPVTVWPMRVTGASLVSVAAAQAASLPQEASQVLRIQLEMFGDLPPAALKIPYLRFFLNGDGTPLHLLYELLFVHAIRVQLRPRAPQGPTEPVVLGADCIRPVGFAMDQGLLDYSDRSFLGYRLLQEYFHFPQKFFFFDLAGLDSKSLDGLGRSFEALIFLRDSELREQMPSIAQAVNADTFQLGCTPIVNLFERSAETIRVSHAVTEYRVVPDRHRHSSMEVYSVDRVSSTVNRDFVSRLMWRRERGELEGEGSPLVEVRCIVPPTKTVRPPLRGSLQWRLISHLSLNHLSIVQGGGREALQEILRLYTFNEDEDIRKRIAGITGLKSESSVSRVLFDSGVAFCRGLDVDLEFDEEQYAGSGVFLLASVLERFFGLYSAVNSYSRLTVRTRQRKSILKRWPARVGAQRIL